MRTVSPLPRSSLGIAAPSQGLLKCDRGASPPTIRDILYHMRSAGRACTEAPNGDALAAGKDARPRAPRAPRVPKTDIQKEALDAAFRSATPLWLPVPP